MDSVYVSVEDAAQIIKPGHSSEPYNFCFRHVKNGNITPVYPEMAIVCPDTGKVIQTLGKSKRMFFLREEVEIYASEIKPLNKTRGRQKAVEVTNAKTGKKQKYESLADSCRTLGLNYNAVYNALRKADSFEDYSFVFL